MKKRTHSIHVYAMRRKKSDMGKAWAKRTQKSPGKPFRNTRTPIAIFCEGNVTEPEYFKKFPGGHVKVYGVGKSKKELIVHILRKLGHDKELKSYEIWAVFDLDDVGSQAERDAYNQAITLAQKNGIETAQSNDAFELWFLLHIRQETEVLKGWKRQEYYRELSNVWNMNYEVEGKTKRFVKAIYDRLNDQIQVARDRAKRLDSSEDPRPFSSRRPHTRVYKLVEKLLD